MKLTKVQIDRERRAFLKGYRTGYAEGLADGHAGKSGFPDLPDLPLEALGLPVCTANSLRNFGCVSVADVARLPAETILSLRGMGKKGADAVARSLQAQGVCHTDWEQYLL